ncbi:hypothetical protein IG631_24033 [Alternaria alternata]|nr:hypothetical protein IG631_24033 [Alternaria alternata]
MLGAIQDVVVICIIEHKQLRSSLIRTQMLFHQLFCIIFARLRLIDVQSSSDSHTSLLVALHAECRHLEDRDG